MCWYYDQRLSALGLQTMEIICYFSALQWICICKMMKNEAKQHFFKLIFKYWLIQKDGCSQGKAMAWWIPNSGLSHYKFGKNNKLLTKKLWKCHYSLALLVLSIFDILTSTFVPKGPPVLIFQDINFLLFPLHYYIVL